MSYYAHSLECGSKDSWQLLADHLNSVGHLAGKYASSFNASNLAIIIGLLHDLGKYTKEFQSRLEGGPPVDHSTWGARLLLDSYSDLGNLLAYEVAGHHTGLPDGQTKDNLKRTSLAERIKASLPPLNETWKQEIALTPPEKLNLPEHFKPVPRRGMFQLSVLARMLFSCLVDADFVDTDNYYRRIEGRKLRETVLRPSLLHLRDILDVNIKKFKQDSDINIIRSKILHHVRGEASHKPGLFSLTVPTGGGKTITSLAFALDHAIAHDLKRIIYVIPYTSIIEQNAQVFREFFGELGEFAVLEHHSSFIDDPKKSFEAKEKRNLAMENWDVPIVVTTAVQFFESLFSNRPSRCRKLHNIAKSVIILDEAQTLPLKLLSPCIALIDELVLNYGSSIVLCTATQPALKVEQGFKDGFSNVHELAPNPNELYLKLRRTHVRHVGTLSDESLITLIKEHEQVLCILNNRRHARFIHEKISEEQECYHLSTLMYAKHRKEVLSKVKNDLSKGKPCRLISTSLVEAGVDIDFPCVLRSEAGLDSIAQAAGRCNREGKRTLKDSEVIVFSNKNKDWQPPVELKQYAQVFQSIARHFKDDLLSLEAVNNYFRELYWQKGENELDAKGLLHLLKCSSIDNLPFETLANKFRIIESVMYPIIIPFLPGTNQIAPEVNGIFNPFEYVPNFFRLFQPYLVQVPEHAYQSLRKSGAIQPLREEQYGNQFMYLVNHDLYRKDTGLSWDNPDFIKAENLVV